MMVAEGFRKARVCGIVISRRGFGGWDLSEEKDVRGGCNQIRVITSDSGQ